MRQTVLITAVDVFASAGGDGTAYAELIRRRTDLDVCYLRWREAADARRPANARALPLRAWYGGACELLPAGLERFFPSFRNAMDIARSVAEARGAGTALTRFDVVDTPGGRGEGLFIRYALQAHGIGVGLTALGPDGVGAPALRLLERLQRRAADVRYGFDEAVNANGLDSLAVIQPSAPAFSPPQPRLPDLVFAGAKDGRGRPDVLLDALGWAPPGSWRELRLIGAAGLDLQGRPMGETLAAVAAARRIAFRDEPDPGRAALQALWRDKTLLAAPSRRPALDLTALEALLLGCPAIVASGSGVARWIEARLPALTHLISDFAFDRSVALQVHELARDYDAVRARLVETISKAALTPDLATLDSVYAEGAGGDERVQARLRAIAEQLMLAGPFLRRRETPSAPRDPVLVAASLFTAALDRPDAAEAEVERQPSGLAFAVRHPAQAARRFAERRLGRGLPEAAEAELGGLTARAHAIARLAAMPERTDRQLADKIAVLESLAAERRVDRVRWASELARLERRRGRPIAGAAHDLRVMGWMGADRLQALPQVLRDLHDGGLSREAEVAEAMYGAPAEAFTRGMALIEAQRTRWKAPPARPPKVLDDRRGDQAPKVSVVVVVSEAGERLQRFLRMLSAQTLMRAGAAEVVLVDRGLSEGPFRTIEAGWPAANANLVYVKAAAPENLSAAWNRGLALARGEHVAILDLDDGLRPDGLARLSSALDATPDANWAMADTLVCEVDRRSVFIRDLEVCDRQGYRTAFRHLDLSGLGLRGGLYRRSLHAHFGGYDEDFRYAGGVEFVARVSPFIRHVHVPERLGVRNLEPQAPPRDEARAEIEGLRAWSLHRTDAGVESAFAAAPEREVEAALAACFSYRRCEAGEAATDLDYAGALARHLKRRSNGAVGGTLAQALAAAAEDLRQLDLWRTPQRGLREQLRFAELVQRIRSGSAWAAGRVGAVSAAEVFNDRRYDPPDAP